MTTAEKLNRLEPEATKAKNVLVIFAGHSGGHLFPAFAFAERARKRYPADKIHLVTSVRGKDFVNSMSPGVFDDVLYLPLSHFPQGISLGTVQFLLELPRVFVALHRFLFRVKPDLCVGFGSFVAYVGLKLAKRMGVATLIHEQNRVPGKATRWLMKFVDCVCESFDGTFEASHVHHLETSGYPVRHDLLQLSKEPKDLHREEGPFRILVVGGSQGAHRLNRVVLEAFGGLLPEEKGKIAVNHITGKADFDFISEKYQEMGVQAAVYPFFERMGELYRSAGMAITRAGAGTLFELASFKIPAVVVPYPLAEGHQLENAKFFSQRHALVYKEESQLESGWLQAKIRLFLGDIEYRTVLSRNFGNCVRGDAAESLVMCAYQLMEGKYANR